MAAPVDLSFLTGGYGPEALPDGTPADPTYLSFLRGMGYSQGEAWSTAIQHVAQIKAAYQTAVSRDPQQLHDELRATNAPYSENNTWWSGQRLADVAETTAKDQQRLADYKTTEAQGLSGEQDTLRQTIAGLARQNADQVGALQQRTDDQHNQDAYIRAVAQANTPQPTATTPPGVTPPPATTTPAKPAVAKPGLAAKLSAMSPAEQEAFRRFTAPKPPPAINQLAPVRTNG